jgi:hypothetical protein
MTWVGSCSRSFTLAAMAARKLALLSSWNSLPLPVGLPAQIRVPADAAEARVHDSASGWGRIGRHHQQQ